MPKKGNEMASELKSHILNFDDLQTEIMEVPEWGDVKIEIRGMTGKARANFMRRASSPQGGEVDFEKFYGELVIATVFDPESGEQVFEFADRDNINQKSGAAIERIAQVAQRLSGLGSADVEDAVGKSEDTPRSAST